MEYHNPKTEPPKFSGLEIACAMIGFAALSVGVTVIIAKLLIYNWQ